jgi:transcriptional regulator with XRE-family HTH domain
MKNNNLANKIKELRIKKGFSQERLADDTQLSLRTIQRIEKGETEARGDTLQRLAGSLNSSIEELTGSAENVDRRLLAVLNLSALSFIVFPLFGIIAPLVTWALVKEKTKPIEEAAKRLLNFQISWCIITGIIYSAFFFNIPLPAFHFIGRPELIMLGIAILYFINFVFIVINTLFGLNAKKTLYLPAVRFIR